MHKRPEKIASEQERDAKLIWQRLLNNKSDEIEDTFCYKLFESGYFDEDLFLELCRDMNLVLNKDNAPKDHYSVLVWIISCIFRSVFSHFDAADFYKIKNFDKEIASRWNADYVGKLISTLEKIFIVSLKT